MAQVFTDDFNRSTIGSNWTLTQGTAGIMSQSNTAWQPNDTGLSHTTYVYGAASIKCCPNQYVKFVMKSVEPSNYAGGAVRADPSGAATFIYFHMSGYDRTVGMFVENTHTQLHNSIVAAANGDQGELRVVGNMITALVNGVIIYEGTIPGCPKSGNYAIHGYTNATGTNNTSLDSWEGGDIITPQGDPMFVPFGGLDFGWSVSNHTTRPAAAMGTAVTPGNNAMGSYTQLLAGLANDAYGVLININSNNVSAAARDTLINIGIDEAGGSSYAVKIPYLLGSCASQMDVLGGIWYYFPLFVRAGSTIAAQASVNNATVGTLRVWSTFFGRPRNPAACKVGSYVEAIGAVSASSRGTLITPGTTADGAWTSLGATTKANWWWQTGMGVNDSTMSALLYALDLAVGSSGEMPLITDQIWRSDATERHSNTPLLAGCERYVPAGTTLYSRLQCSGTADSNTSVIAYGLGG